MATYATEAERDQQFIARYERYQTLMQRARGYFSLPCGPRSGAPEWVELEQLVRDMDAGCQDEGR